MAVVDNRYGHPHTETITAPNVISAKLYGTDINGTIIARTDGRTYSVSKER
ncbi:hypothetical protein ACFLTZ_00215 [Chloroflexota bacterium]